MIITDALKKLEQVNRIMESKGFHILYPNDCETLQDVADRFTGAEWCKLTWGELIYTKHYGKNLQHCCIVTLGTTEKYYHQTYNFYVSHLDISKARISFNYTKFIIGNDYLENREDLSHSWKYQFEIEKNVDALRKLLNKVSSHIDY